MTATMTPLANRKKASASKSVAIDRIHNDLDEMVSRLRREIWVGGTLVVGATAMATLLAILVLDALFQPESAWLRAALWLPLIGLVGTVTQRLLVTPLKQECDRLAMAWTLEQRQPAIEERLTTSLQLTATSNGNTSTLIEAVAQQAQGSLAGCQDEDFRGQEVLRRTIIAGTCVAVFVLSMWIWAAYLIPSLQNVLNPFGARVLPYLNAIVVPGNTHVGEGGNLRVTATASRLRDAVLEVIENDHVLATHQMVNGTNGTPAEFTLTELKSDLQYRVRSGGLYSDCYHIYVDPKPVIKSSHVTLTFPEYTQLPQQVINDLAESIDAIHGTRIRIDINSTLPCTESSLALDGTSIPCREAVLDEETGLWRHFWEFTATEGDVHVGTITLVSEAGVLSDPFNFDVRVVPDLPPSIVIDQPAMSEIIATPAQIIQITYHAVDDFGCSALQLVSQENGDPPSMTELPYDPETELNGELTVDLDELELTTGDQLTVWLSISDSRPDEYGGSQVTDSRKIRVQIADEAIPVGQQVVRNEVHRLLTDLTKAIEGLQQAAERANDLQTELDDVAEARKTPDEIADQSKRLRDQIQDAEQTLCRLTDQGERAPQSLFQPEIERVQEVSDNEVAEAKRQVGLVPLSDDRPQQQEAIAATKESLNDAIGKLEKVREEVNARGEQLELAAQLDELARQQERLAQELNEVKDNAPDAQKKQQEVADSLQEVIEKDLDAKSEQFAQRAEKADELTKTAAELQQQQEALAKLDQVRGKEELDDQLLDMIAREQEQIAKEARKLEGQARSNDPPTADARIQAEQKNNEPTEADQNGKPNAIAEARQQMEAVPEKIKEKDLEQAEVEARQAGERLQEEAKSLPPNRAVQPNANMQDKAPPTDDDLKRLAKQQKRISDAIKAVREDRPKEAIAKLQEQVADRTGRLRHKADELLQLPTEDSENQQAVQQAREKLAQAEKETKTAEQLAMRQPMPAGEQQKQVGDPMPAGEQKKQAGEPMPAGEQQKQADAPKQTGEQQKQAAKSLQEATQSLETVCKSCQKCSKCNKPSASAGSSGGKPKSGGNQSASKEGDQPKKSQPGPKSGESGQPSPQAQQPGSKKLAETADKAHQAAQAPSPERAQELAQDLNQLADATAQQAGYRNRSAKSNEAQSKPSKSSDSQQQAGVPQPGNTSKPQGVQGNAGANQSEVAPTQLRGRSTSNWTQSRRQLKNNVLDDQDSKIPEEFRGVVKDYFEELSRLESRQDAAEVQE